MTVPLPWRSNPGKWRATGSRSLTAPSSTSAITLGAVATALGERGEIEDGVGGHRLPCRADRSLTERLPVDGVPVVGDQDHRARELPLRDRGLDGLADLRQVRGVDRRGARLSGLRREGEGKGGRNRGGGKASADGAHGVAGREYTAGSESAGR